LRELLQEAWPQIGATKQLDCLKEGDKRSSKRYRETEGVLGAAEESTRLVDCSDHLRTTGLGCKHFPIRETLLRLNKFENGAREPAAFRVPEG
jgi:hypothetical protein